MCTLFEQVHGGTSQQDIIDCVKKTEELAKVNCERNKKLYTILFFDEANTTENIGLIKEIMCDRRLNGKLISDNVKFIAACNPYRKLGNIYEVSSCIFVYMMNMFTFQLALVQLSSHENVCLQVFTTILTTTLQRFKLQETLKCTTKNIRGEIRMMY